jgi:hypothetical protein
MDITVGDYRVLHGELLAHEAIASGPAGISIRIHLDQARVLPARPPP